MAKYFSETEFTENETPQLTKGLHGFHAPLSRAPEELKTPLQMARTVRQLISRHSVRVPPIENARQCLPLSFHRAHHHKRTLSPDIRLHSFGQVIPAGIRKQKGFAEKCPF
jgi:hypothetical protein